jgi:hypothetical protein
MIRFLDGHRQQTLLGTAAVRPLWWLALVLFVAPVFHAEELRKMRLRHRAQNPSLIDVAGQCVFAPMAPRL